MTGRRITLAALALLAACHAAEPAAPATSAGSAPPVEATAAKADAPAVAPPGGSAAASGAAVAASTWGFDADKVGDAPAGFSFGRTGGGKPGRWVVKAEPDAPSRPNVLAQVDADGTDDRFPVAVADAPSLRDVRLSVKCKPMSGSVDQACGLVLRYRDEKNYYLTRANALENNVRFYHVKDGRRRQIEGWNGPVTGKAWHDLRIEARGDRFEVYWDGKRVIEAKDATFPDAGKVGVWTKADSVTYFDDLAAAPL